MGTCAICLITDTPPSTPALARMPCCGAEFHFVCLLASFRNITGLRFSCPLCREPWTPLPKCNVCSHGFDVPHKEWLYVLESLYLTFNKQIIVPNFSNPEITSCFLNKCSQLAKHNYPAPCAHQPDQVCNYAFAIFFSSEPSSLPNRQARRKTLGAIFSMILHCITLTVVRGNFQPFKQETLSLEQLVNYLATLMHDPSYIKYLSRLIQIENAQQDMSVIYNYVDWPTFFSNLKQKIFLDQDAITLKFENLSMLFSNMAQKIFSITPSEFQAILQQSGLEMFVNLQQPIIDPRYFPRCTISDHLAISKGLRFNTLTSESSSEDMQLKAHRIIVYFFACIILICTLSLIYFLFYQSRLRGDEPIAQIFSTLFPLLSLIVAIFLICEIFNRFWYLRATPDQVIQFSEKIQRHPVFSILPFIVAILFLCSYYICIYLDSSALYSLLYI